MCVFIPVCGDCQMCVQILMYAYVLECALKALCHAIRADCLLMKPDAPTR